MARIFKQCEINSVLDIGANQGQFAKSLRKRGYAGEIHSFEPVADSFKVLQQYSSSDANWYVYNIALGDECAFKDIHVSKASDLSSFLPASNFGSKRFASMAETHTETVEISTVDMFLSENDELFKDKKIFLKMDTQGFDVRVFNGARDSWPAIAGLLSELSFQKIYKGIPTYLEALSVYEQAGYKITGLFPIVRNNDLTLVEMDCVMIKS
ncbi:MAG: FkbM family methyltransferase [Robiginitomaculum sp.]|nr:FkbM family methyltransferase [Robiginitomaculum sp.]